MVSRCWAAAALLLLTSQLQPVASQPSDFELYILSNASAARYGGYCLDGTPPGFYWRKGAGSGATKWIYHFRGGAWCFTPDDCAQRAKSDLGSSNYFLPDISKTPNIYAGLMDTIGPGSPFEHWNVVFQQYCDGSSGTSDRDAPLPVGNSTLFFRGKRALFAMLRELEDLAGLLSAATDFVYSGTSAGGLAVYATQALVRSYFTAPALRFVVAPDSGYFLDAVNAVTGTRAFRQGFQAAVGPDLWNSTGGTNAACVAAYPDDAWKCLFAQYLVPFMDDAPLFIANSMADQWSVNNVLGLPCTPGTNCDAGQMASFFSFQADLQSNITHSVSLHNSSGLFLTGCLQHGQTCSDGDWYACTIGAVSQNTTFTAWHLSATGGPRASVPTVAIDKPWPSGERCQDVAHGWC